MELSSGSYFQAPRGCRVRPLGGETSTSNAVTFHRAFDENAPLREAEHRGSRRLASTKENPRLPYATGSTGLALTVRGSSRRIMIMRF